MLASRFLFRQNIPVVIFKILALGRKTCITVKKSVVDIILFRFKMLQPGKSCSHAQKKKRRQAPERILPSSHGRIMP